MLVKRIWMNSKEIDKFLFTGLLSRHKIRNDAKRCSIAQMHTAGIFFRKGSDKRNGSTDLYNETDGENNTIGE